MSAPNTNIDKQEKDHKPMLSRGVLFALFGGIILLALVIYMSLGGEVPVGGDLEPVVSDGQAD